TCALPIYRNKSKNILQTCRILVEQYQGEVPAEREALEKLPGVGRKTANVVLSNAFGVPALAVDTHVQRVSNRLGLADSKNPLETEKQLTEKIPREEWSIAHHRDRKSTRLNSSHVKISYAVFCLKKKK